MPSTAPGPPGRNPAMRIMIVDDHEISRAACRALLRAEGADLLADLGADEHVLTAASVLQPDVVIVDVTPPAGRGFGIARRLHALPVPPVVILTSSAARARFGPEVSGYRFVAKADISAPIIAQLAGAPEFAEPPEFAGPGRDARRITGADHEITDGQGS